MKRTISLIIAIAVMVSMFIVPVSAADVTSVDAIVPGESVLQSDIGNGASVKIITTGEYVIDLNGYKWTGRMEISGDAVVTIKDSSTAKTGTIDASQSGDGIDVKGNAVVVLENITVIGGLDGGDAIFVGGEPTITAKNCVLTAGKVGIDNTSSASTIIVEDTTFADFADYAPGLGKDGQGRNGAIELRAGAKVTLKGNNTFTVNTIIARDNHTSEIKDSFVYGENASATFGDVYTVTSIYTGAKITYTYTAPATPTVEPTTAPTAEPTTAPTVEPTTAPTVEPTTAPTVEPTTAPTVEPTTAPTVEPTTAPTEAPAEPTNEITVPVEDVEFDMAELGGTADFAPHGYGDKIGVMLGYGNVKSLGVRDLSKYSKIIITYATHHPYLNKYDDMPCNSMFAVCQNDSTVGYWNVDKRAEAGILAQQDTTDSTGMWVNGERKCEIDLTGVDYNGEVFLSHYNSTDMEALVTSIVLVAAEGATTTVPGGSTDSGNTNNGDSNPNTGNFMPFVIVVAAAALVVTVLSKKRAF